MLPALVRVITLLESVDKIKNLLWDETTQDASLRGKKLYATAEMNYKINFFQGVALTNYLLPIPDPAKPFAVATGTVYRSKYDGNLYIQAQLVRNIGNGYLGAWDNETVFIKAIDVKTENKSNQKTNYLPLLILIGTYFLIQKK